jgi:signal transduction histidine kinase
MKSGLSALVDPLAVTQALFNLIDNAVKYSGDGRDIEVETGVQANNVVIRVKDCGIGVPDSLKWQIFLPFVRGDDSRVTSQRGSGIGLSVVKQLVEQMGGSIRMFDNTPKGTVFEVILPGAGNAISRTETAT